MDDAQALGRRVRKVRAWRQLDLRAAAALAGLSHGYLGRIERGEQPVTSRRTLEALARALQVSPTELTGQPWAPTDLAGSEAHAALLVVETTLESLELGEDPGGEPRLWPAVAEDVERLATLMHVSADYAAQGELAPRLLTELHALYARQTAGRPDLLQAMITAYSSLMFVAKRLGGRGLPALAAQMVQRCAEELEAPEWLGYAVWLRGDATGSLNRARQYSRAVQAADELTGNMDNEDVLQSFGMLHLSASLAAGAQGDTATAQVHLEEAAAAAERLDAEVGQWASLWFGRTNVGIWRVSLAAELGEGAKLAEIARDVHPEMIASPSRQAEFFADVGRSLLTETSTREKGLHAILHAETLAPQRIRHDLFVRESVSDLLRTAQQGAGGRELRGLAWRMGVAPVG